MSFERAVLFLGANIIHTESGGIFSSAAKGESLADTARVVSGVGLDIGYADLLIIRHPEEYAVEKAAEFSRVPVINAGDGQHQHPTQAFLDLATIFLRFGRIDNISIAMIGDIHSGRTIRSLCYLLSKFKGVKIYLVSPEEIRIKNDIREHLEEREVWFCEETDLNSVLPKVDVCYFTRLQAERYQDQKELFEKIKKKVPQYSLSKNNINLIPNDSIVLHPLPIGDDEIRENCKDDKRIWAFIQSDIGVATRMALINRIFRELAKNELHERFRQTIFSSLAWK
jgi:aspartate carbamoyltransferase catalytic subunit